MEKLYQQFISDVAESRDLSINEVEDLATGWIYLGSEAVDLGLIDKVGTYKDAIEEAARLGGVSGKPVIVSGARRLSLYDILLQYYLDGLLQRIFFLDF